ncbi:hypothetical protein T492DRAFT_1152547 [Pavlovales sp. CCMP2436]|nr:hypothetical protein T492DRAFT_1152547 [Pavlovales sp. CCMP2436]
MAGSSKGGHRARVEGEGEGEGKWEGEEEGKGEGEGEGDQLVLEGGQGAHGSETAQGGKGGRACLDEKAYVRGVGLGLAHRSQRNDSVANAQTHRRKGAGTDAFSQCIDDRRTDALANAQTQMGYGLVVVSGLGPERSESKGIQGEGQAGSKGLETLRAGTRERIRTSAS